MDSVKKYFVIEYGCVKNWLVYVDYIIEVGVVILFLLGLKENVVIFCYVNIWVIIVEVILG